jgi:hypothetical protein
MKNMPRLIYKNDSSLNQKQSYAITIIYSNKSY